MTLIGLARSHALMVWRQKAIWFTAIPLTAHATLIAIISPAAPGTGGIEDITFTAQMIAVFTGIAYAVAFAEFFSGPAKLGMRELEASAPVTPLVLRCARVLGAFTVIVMPSCAVLLIMGGTQTISGSPWSLPAALGVAVTIVGLAALTAIALSGLCGVILPRALGRIVAVLIWFVLSFSSPHTPIPTLNGSVLTTVGDPVVTGYFGADPIYPPVGPLGYDGTPLGATVSLTLQVVLVIALLVGGSVLAARLQKH